MLNKYMMYKCLECGKEKIVSTANIKDGLSCLECGGHLSPQGFIAEDGKVHLRPTDERMDYKKVIEGQIKELQMLQQSIPKQIPFTESICTIAKTISLLCLQAKDLCRGKEQ